MAELRGQALWPNLPRGDISCSGTCSWGVTPGTATLEIPVLEDGTVGVFPDVGDLTFRDGAQSVTWKDCKIVKPAGTIDASGQRVSLLIEDRRWRWRFGEISGVYNDPAERTATVPAVGGVRAPAPAPPAPPREPAPGEEPVKPWTRKTAPQLAVLCLGAMGETNYDISALDPTATPTVSWDATNPAMALQALAESLGCVVCLRHGTNSVLVARRGEGEELPEGPLGHFAKNPDRDAKARPSRLVLRGARTRYQMRFALEAVGKDFDGGIKPIDQLSYRPVSGNWLKCGGPPGFADLIDTGLTSLLPGGRTFLDALALAQGWVFRAYRVKVVLSDEGGPTDFSVPPKVLARGEDQVIPVVKVKRIDQIRLLPVKNLGTKDDLGREALAAAACYGRHSPRSMFRLDRKFEVAVAATDARTQVQTQFSVDAEHQLIHFSDYVYILENGQYGPAEIVLECACEVQDPDTDQYVRYSRELPLPGGLDTKPAVIVDESVRYLVTAEYDDTADVDHARNTDNRRDVERRADYLLRGEAVRYLPAEAGDRDYVGIQPIDCDGAIQQVTWRVGGRPDGVGTRASRNTEHALYLPAYAARRRIEETSLEGQRRANLGDYVQAVALAVPVVL